MANEAGKRLLKLTEEYLALREGEAYDGRFGESHGVRSEDEIAAEYETVIRSMFGPQVR